MNSQTIPPHPCGTGSSGPSGTAPIARRHTIAFLNCKNLFEVNRCSRAPKSDVALADKMFQLAQLLDGLKLAKAPTFICLCEVGTPNLGIGVTAVAFPTANYQVLWSHDGIPDADETGLMILYDANVLVNTNSSQLDRPLRNKGQRSRWLAAKFSLPTAASDLGIVVNHWSSSVHSETDAAYQRRRSADEIADLFRGIATLNGRGPTIFGVTDPVILIGDLNCDPFDPIFSLSDKGAWVSSHVREAVECATRPSPCFYNPLLKAPGIDSTIGGGLNSRMVDYLLFSQGFLQAGGTFSYVDGSIRTSPFDPRASDHLAISADFEIP